MKILHLTLKAKFYDMIEAGIKPEEYRETKMYWRKRLLCLIGNTCQFWNINGGREGRHDINNNPEYFRKFDAVKFARGGHFHPSVKQMTWQLKEIIIGTGNSDWGAEPGKEYFVIKLGEIIPQ